MNKSELITPITNDAATTQATSLARMEGLAQSWEARSRDAQPSDAKLIILHIRELREALSATQVGTDARKSDGWGPIDANALEAMAKSRPDECFLKGSGVLKLTGAIRQLEREARALKAAALSAPQGAPAVPASAEAEAEHFIQMAVDRAPDPLGRLGEYLQGALDEDQWATAEKLLLGAMLHAAPQPAGDAALVSNAEIAEWRAMRSGGMVSAVGEYTPEEFWRALDEIERFRAALAAQEGGAA